MPHPGAQDQPPLGRGDVHRPVERPLCRRPRRGPDPVRARWAPLCRDGRRGQRVATLAQEQAQRARVQDTSSPKGKILRITESGAVPVENPFVGAAFACGFRNVFGFDFDPVSGQLWATDNGPDPSYQGEPAGPGPNGGCN
ncbi:MAG TPA: PQQ-dependent sugar dehydrogenase [Acidimicrobiales bacterium]|nr:PQQ-dependent sugar dehydrogenase [Acidimicrobiales bacterium]